MSAPELSDALARIREAADTVADLAARRDLAMADLAAVAAERDRATRGQRDAHALAVLVSRALGGEIPLSDPSLRIALSRVQRSMLGEFATAPEPEHAATVTPLPPSPPPAPRGGGVPVTPYQPAPVGPRPGGMALPLPPLVRS